MMSDLAQFIAFVLSVALLIGFFMIVNRTGLILLVLRSLEQKINEQTRYLAAIAPNVSKMQRTLESLQTDELKGKQDAKAQ
jgi:uncharacterized ion transporter superfamily protein YfcC